jgi:hypothetical protein
LYCWCREDDDADDCVDVVNMWWWSYEDVVIHDDGDFNEDD